MIMAFLTNIYAKTVLFIEALQEGAALHREMRRQNPGAFGHE
ncbi:hypothetical protein [Rhabdaerophilum sp. SD176]|nr:hypothetical protein [Rhabdaerophilum sp. SD176]